MSKLTAVLPEICRDLDAEVRSLLSSLHPEVLLTVEFFPTRRFADAMILVEGLANQYEPSIRFTPEGVWTVDINGSPTVYGQPGELKIAITRAFAQAFRGELKYEVPSQLPDARADGRDEPLSGSRAAPDASPSNEL